MRRLATVGLGILFGVVIAAGSAHADTRVAALSPPGETPDEPQRVDTVAPVDTSDPIGALATNDAASDRAFGRSTAIALGAGQFDFSLRTVVEHASMLSIAAGVGRGVELSIDVGYGRNVVKDLGLGLKIGLAQHQWWAASFDASLRVVTVDGDSDGAALATADLKLSTCMLDCGVLFTIGGGIAIAGSDANLPVVPFADISMLFGTGVVRPMVEAFSLMGAVNFGFAGVRIGGKHVAFDVGAGILAGDESDDAGAGLVVGLGVRP